MKPKEVHKYDPKSGDYMDTYASGAIAESKHGLMPYSSSIGHAIRKGRKAAGFFWSFEKRDNYFKPEREPLEMKAENPTKENQHDFLDEDEIRRKHDLFSILQNEIKQIPRGKFIEEERLLRRLGIYGKPGSKKACEKIKHEMPENRGKADGIIYYGHSESVSKLKSEGVLTT